MWDGTAKTAGDVEARGSSQNTPQHRPNLARRGPIPDER
jgi:hypothetical protein